MEKERITLHIEKPTVRGGSRRILVDGVEWGLAVTQSRGLYGYFVEFRDTARRIIYRMGERPAQWKVWSDKRAAREGDPRPIEVRLMSEVKAMIEAGALRHPTIVRSEVERKQDVYRERQQEAEQRALTALETKAQEVVDSLGGSITTVTAEGLKKEIIAAMKWAQTQ